MSSDVSWHPFCDTRHQTDVHTKLSIVTRSGLEWTAVIWKRKEEKRCTSAGRPTCEGYRKNSYVETVPYDGYKETRTQKSPSLTQTPHKKSRLLFRITVWFAPFPPPLLRSHNEINKRIIFCCLDHVFYHATIGCICRQASLSIIDSITSREHVDYSFRQSWTSWSDSRWMWSSQPWYGMVPRCPNARQEVSAQVSQVAVCLPKSCLVAISMATSRAEGDTFDFKKRKIQRYREMISHRLFKGGVFSEIWIQFEMWGGDPLHMRGVCCLPNSRPFFREPLFHLGGRRRRFSPL